MVDAPRQTWECFRVLWRKRIGRDSKAHDSDMSLLWRWRCGTSIVTATAKVEAQGPPSRMQACLPKRAKREREQAEGHPGAQHAELALGPEAKARSRTGRAGRQRANRRASLARNAFSAFVACTPWQQQRWTHRSAQLLRGPRTVPARPSDSEIFLDSPGMRWVTLRYGAHAVGLTVSAMEEPMRDTAVAEALWLRRRKVAGHLTVQTLAREAGFWEASTLRYARMMRLCVHPAAQKRGFGRLLLEESLRVLRAQEGVEWGTAGGQLFEMSGI